MTSPGVCVAAQEPLEGSEDRRGNDVDGLDGQAAFGQPAQMLAQDLIRGGEDGNFLLFVVAATDHTYRQAAIFHLLIFQAEALGGFVGDGGGQLVHWHLRHAQVFDLQLLVR